MTARIRNNQGSILGYLARYATRNSSSGSGFSRHGSNNLYYHSSERGTLASRRYSTRPYGCSGLGGWRYLLGRPYRRCRRR